MAIDNNLQSSLLLLGKAESGHFEKHPSTRAPGWDSAMFSCRLVWDVIADSSMGVVPLHISAITSHTSRHL